MGTLIQDIRIATRMLVKNPGFSIVVVLTLAIGIGANTALFSLVNGVLLEPLRFPQADQLVALYENKTHFEYGSISYPNFLDWQSDNRTLQSIAAFRPDDFSLTGLGEPVRMRGMMVSATFFPTVGVSPELGRGLDSDQDRLGGKPEVLISAGLWKTKFGSAPDVVGKTMTLNGKDYTIVGVVPASFHLDMQNFRTSDLYLPIGQWNERRELAIEVDDHKIVRRLRHVIEHDWKHSRPIDLSDEALSRDLKKYGPEVIHELALTPAADREIKPGKSDKSKQKNR